MADTADTNEALNEATLGKLRQRLLDERGRILQTLQTMDQFETVQPLGDPLNQDARDFSEMGRDITDEATNLALSENEQRQLEQIDHALERLKQGTYGYSEVSGKPIPLERLEALPWATTNVEDAPESTPDRGTTEGSPI